MSNYTALIDSLIINDEGGWKLTSNKNDPDGGWTYAGVTAKVWNSFLRPGATIHDKNWITYENMHAALLTEIDEEQCKQWVYTIYQEEYCEPLHFDKLPEYIRPALLSCTVNCGLETAVKILQGALAFPPNGTDGVIGPQTIRAVNLCGSEKLPDVALLPLFLREWMRHYVNLVQENAKAWELYARQYDGTHFDPTVDKPKVNRAATLEGWLNRVERYRR